MYIQKITIENIKGFGHLELDLDRGNSQYAGWSVFVGDNGSGKSTLLKAIAICLAGTDTARALQPSFHRWIRDDAQGKASIELEIVRCTVDDSWTEGGRTAQATFPAKIAFENGDKETSMRSQRPSTIPNKKYRSPERSIWSSNSQGWFSCGYGPFRRVFGASPEAMRQMVAPTTGRFVTMFEEAASLSEVDQWLRNLKHKELEYKSDAKNQLDSILDLLRDDLMPNGISVDRVDSDGLWLKDRNKVPLAWNEMSDGYRSAAALLCDIIRHLVATYGFDGLFGKDSLGKTIIKRSGVVLIDEIDAHLHPEWQREIGFWLKKHFPKIQFLVTTHSPLICQAADERGIFHLPEPGSDDKPRRLSDEEYREIIASTPNTILLSPAFGLENTFSPPAVNARAEYAKLKNKERSGGVLNPDETRKLEQLELFATTDEEG